MSRNNLSKKGFTYAVIVLFIGLAITPICTAQITNTTENSNNKSLGLGRYFGLEGDIKFSYNATTFRTPIIPLTGEVTAPISVSYKVTGMLAKFIIRLIAGGIDMEITLSVEEAPEYATVRVSPHVVTPRISSRWESAECYVHISVNEDAPAYGVSFFALKATSVSIKGPLGLFTLIHDAEHVQEIPFVPAYLPIIHIVPEADRLETPPGKISQLNITMENLGNGRTIIDSKILNFPSQEWWGYIHPETILDVGESKVVSMLLLAPENYSGHDQIEIVSTGRYYFYDPLNLIDSCNWSLIVFYSP